MKTGLTCGAFDLLHAGHCLLLKDCKSVCDWLTVGLQTDPTVDRPGKNKPVQSLKERRIQLKAVRYVDEIFEYRTEKELLLMLKEINPDIRIIGSDYKGREQDITGYVLNIPIHWHQRNHEWSSTELRERISKCQT